jgi:hypothetical protein
VVQSRVPWSPRLPLVGGRRTRCPFNLEPSGECECARPFGCVPGGCGPNKRSVDAMA